LMMWLPLQRCNKCRKFGIGGSSSSSELLVSCTLKLWWNSMLSACMGLQASRMARGKLFDAALFAAAQLADGDTALRLLHRMWGERLPAGYLAHGHVIRALCNAKRFKVTLSATV
jgi:hypothetical protein